MRNRQLQHPFIVILFLFLFGLGNLVNAQTINEKKSSTFNQNWAISTNLGLTQFYGDVSSHSFFDKLSGESSFSPDLRIRKMFTPIWGVGASLFYTGLSSIKDIKSDGTVVNFSLSGNYYDAGLFLYLDISNLLFNYKSTRKWNVFGTLGFGYGMWNSTLTDNITSISIKSGSPNGTGTFATGGMVVPIGLGLSYRFSPHWGVQLGGEFRTVLNDDVDVWHDGFQYDQLFTAKLGVTYHIHPGWTRGKLKKLDKPKKEECCEEDLYKNKKAIPVFDYTYNAPTPASSNPVKVEVMHIDKANSSGAPKTYPGNAFRDFEFRVQILAKSTRLPHPESLQSKYRLDFPVLENYQDGLYRYSTGSFDRYQDALAHSKKIRSHGVFDAFVVAYSHGMRIKLTKEMKTTVGKYQPSADKQETYQSNVIY
jgi:hypothetical protein